MLMKAKTWQCDTLNPKAKSKGSKCAPLLGHRCGTSLFWMCTWHPAFLWGRQNGSASFRLAPADSLTLPQDLQASRATFWISASYNILFPDPRPCTSGQLHPALSGIFPWGCKPGKSRGIYITVLETLFGRLNK